MGDKVVQFFTKIEATKTKNVSGYTCDVTAGTCLKGDEIIPFFLKRPARPTYQWL
jgi:hypothetical protein